MQATNIYAPVWLLPAIIHHHIRISIITRASINHCFNVNCSAFVKLVVVSSLVIDFRVNSAVFLDRNRSLEATLIRREIYTYVMAKELVVVIGA